MEIFKLNIPLEKLLFVNICIYMQQIQLEVTR